MSDVLGKRINAVNDVRGKLFQRKFAKGEKTAHLHLCRNAVSALGSTSNAPTMSEASGDQEEPNPEIKKIY